jgi:hypothetical protein
VAAGQAEIIAERQIAAEGRVALRLQVPGANASDVAKFERVAESDARILTTTVAGGFVGATVGPHARVE